MANINTISDIFFTSDYHLNHGKILWLGKGRPFGPQAQLMELGRKWSAAENYLNVAKGLLKEGKVSAESVKVFADDEAALKHELKALEAIGLAEMNEAIIERRNSVVKKSSRVYNLGDVFLNCTLEQALAWQKRLIGQNFLLEGNHDSIAVQMAKHGAWIWVKDRKRIDVVIPQGIMDANQTKHKIMLSHYAHLTWHGSNKGVWHLYGHSHSQLENWKNRVLSNMLSFDVGVDCWDFYPPSLEQVIEKMKPKIEAWKAWRASLQEEMDF
jgi:calcineurin-like phosphoesterase family protein